jgi:hypothetical protein
VEAIQLELPLGLPESSKREPEPATPSEQHLDEQEFAAIVNARLLLQRLGDPQLTPRIPREVRAEARALLRWLPRREMLRKKVGIVLPWRVKKG